MLDMSESWIKTAIAWFFSLKTPEITMNMLFARRFLVFLSLSAFTVLGNGMYAQLTIAGEIKSSSQQNPPPMPGTTTTSAAALSQTTPTSEQAEVEETDASEVAQVDVDPGQATRGGSSYIGVAGNVGVGGDSALGDNVNFTVISKIGFTNSISARPSVVIDDDPVILIPITYDFSTRSVDPLDETLSIAPYVGAGIGISTGGEDDDDDIEDVLDDDDDDDDDGDVGVLLTGGVDIPFSDQFTGTAAVNVGFFDDTEVGLVLGVGYNFSGFQL